MKTDNTDSDFYVGYLNSMPMATAFWLKKVIAVGFLILFLLVAAFAYLQSPMNRGVYEFGISKAYEGVLFADPLPVLQTAERSYILVGNGKFGAQNTVRKWLGGQKARRVKLNATLIERAPLAMLEIDGAGQPEFISEIGVVELTRRPTEIIGQVELTGELVDSKCFLGVMRPAVGKVHRGCAIRCLAGGVPPGLLLRNSDINSSVMVLLLSGAAGKFVVDPQWAGRKMTARGQLEMQDGLPVLVVEGPYTLL